MTLVEPVHVDGTEPYAWPYDGRLVPTEVALVLAGWDEHWAGRSIAPQDALAHCLSLATAVGVFGGLVVGIDHGLADPRAEPPGALALPPDAVRVGAAGIDGFHGSPLDAILRARGRTHLLVAGMGLEGPVHSTLRSANDRGYECLLLTDACASLDADLADAAACTVTMSGGIFGAIGTTAATLARLGATA
jgi:hypothetical protein